MKPLLIGVTAVVTAVMLLVVGMTVGFGVTAAAAGQLCQTEPTSMTDPGPQGNLSNAQYIWRTLLADGMSEQAAAGVLGNLQQESGLDPKLVQPDGPGMGLVQWSRGERWDGPGGLVPWAQAHNLDEWSLQTQVTWMLREMHQGWGSFDLAHFKTMTDVVEATIYFHDTYEVSADSAEFVRSTRGGYALDWYRQLHGTPAAAPAVTGSVFIVGDSLTVGSEPAIKALYRQRQIPVTIAATESLTTAQGARLVDSPAARAAQTWVVALGTNDFDARQFSKAADQLLAAAGNRRVVWVNIARDRNPAPINQAIADLAHKHAGVQVVDYAAAAASRPDDLARDGVHLTPAGYRWRAQLYLPVAAPTAQSFNDPGCDPGSGGQTTCPKAPDSVLPPDIRGHMQPNALAVADCVVAGWPEIRDLSPAWRPSDPYPDHPSGQAVDIMMPQGCAQTPAKLAMGNEIATFLMKNADAYRIKYMIWQQKIWKITEDPVPPAQWRGMSSRGGCTEDHMDHVHVTVDGPDPAPGGFTYHYKTPESSTRPCPPRLQCAAVGTVTGAPRQIIDQVIDYVDSKYHCKETSQNTYASNERHGATTSGGRSDHQGPPDYAWAVDLGTSECPGGVATLDKIGPDLSAIYGIGWTRGLKEVAGYRLQLIWHYPDHEDHLHFGVRRTTGPVPPVPPDFR